MAYVIFDLDGTVIDSAHRHASKPDGSIDLEHWFDNATPEKIAKDGLLPLVRSMRSLYDAGHHIVICTARCMKLADFQFLAANNIPYHHILYRQGRFVSRDHPEYANSYYGFIGDGRDDAEMKAALLHEFFAKRDLRLGVDVEPIMFDDNLKVVARMIREGVHCLDAKKLNKRMKPLAA